MCKAISGIAVRDRDDVKVYTSKVTDSHTDTRDEFGIKDDNSITARYQTPVELVPVRDLFKVEGMDFRFDDKKPGWWTDSMTESAIKQLHRAWLKRWKGKTLKFEGDIDLSELEKLPDGVRLETECNIRLNSLTSMGTGNSLEAGYNIYLNNLTSMGDNNSLEAGRSIRLNRLTSMDKGNSLKVGYNINLDKLTSMGDNNSLEAGYDIDLNSLTSIPKGLKLRQGIRYI